MRPTGVFSSNSATRTASEQCLLSGWAANGPPMLNAPYANAMQATAVLYGAPVWGFAIIWLLLATTITAPDQSQGGYLLARFLLGS